MTVGEAVQATTDCLGGIDLDDYRIESEFLVSAFLGIPRTHLLLKSDLELPEESVRSLQRWVAERQLRKPLAYVSGEQPFMDASLAVDPSVLIPRPETELLVERALHVLESCQEPVLVVDVGTGSGNMAVCLARHPKVHRVIGIDISKESLEVAKMNANRYGVDGQCIWVEGDLLSSFLSCGNDPIKERPFLVVANLPYVKTSEITHLEPELHWEPRRALDGGADGLRLISRCIEQATDVLIPGGRLLLEIGSDQAMEITRLLETGLQWTDICVYQDLAGLPRIVHARR